ncbi:MAG: hypothetical protein FVQ79_12265 [Planctomycetes bacterium]|nr:hypothetical protein [Planctomycetota bacterium]
MISALDRLRALRTGKSLEETAGIDKLPVEWRYEYEERAAILEYDGGLSRIEADSQALREIFERIRSIAQI